MNTKRIAAALGLVLIILSVLCIVCVGVLPQVKDLLMTVSTITFIGAAAILGVLVYRRKAEEESSSGEDGEKDA